MILRDPFRIMGFRIGASDKMADFPRTAYFRRFTGITFPRSSASFHLVIAFIESTLLLRLVDFSHPVA
jgi:hypothetical protein